MKLQILRNKVLDVKRPFVETIVLKQDGNAIKASAVFEKLTFDLCLPVLALLLKGRSVLPSQVAKQNFALGRHGDRKRKRSLNN